MWFDYNHWVVDDIDERKFEVPEEYNETACGLGNLTHHEQRGTTFMPYRDPLQDIHAHTPQGKEWVRARAAIAIATAPASPVRARPWRRLACPRQASRGCDGPSKGKRRPLR